MVQIIFYLHIEDDSELATQSERALAVEEVVLAENSPRGCGDNNSADVRFSTDGSVVKSENCCMF